MYVTSQFHISHEKLYFHVSMIRIVANSFEDHIQENAICISTVFVPKKSINRNCLHETEISYKSQNDFNI